MQTTEYQWCEVNLPAIGVKRVPKWARRAALSTDGTVFIPSLVAGGEATVLLCASFDGVRSLVDGKHAYPADWVAREFPHASETAAFIERRVREFFDDTSLGDSPV